MTGEKEINKEEEEVVVVLVSPCFMQSFCIINPFFLLLEAAGPHEPNPLGAASPKRMWLLCHQGMRREGGKRGQLQWQGKGVPGHSFCLFIYICILHGITVLVFNDV